MTREEAYNRIDAIIAKYEIDDEYVTITSDKDYDALRMARSSLEQEPCEDAISRRAAIDVIERWLECSDYNEAERHIMGATESILYDLPPVTPQQKCEDIAKAFQFGMAFGFGEKHDEMDKVIDEIKKVIAPQPKTGHWIIIDDCERFIAKCSECGRIEDSRMINKYPYCHCGAKMQKVEE